MSYPLIIKDDFFSDPDYISRMTKEINYSSSDNSYPGVRTEPIYEINFKLFLYITQKIFLLLHDELPSTYNMDMRFHKVKPYIEDDKWDKKNRGWIHSDNCLFGGIIYLDKNPDKDAGTGIYKSKDGFPIQTKESMESKEFLYSGQLIDDGHYYDAYDRVRNQYEETLRISNLYNRLVLIPGNKAHAMTTTGDKERHTIVFFCYDIMGVSLPEYKSTPNVPIPNHALYT